MSGPATLDEGVNIRLVGDARSSTATALSILSSAVGEDDPEFAARITRARDWRHSYPQHFRDLTALEGRSSEVALRVARSGLAAATEALAFVVDGRDHPLSTAQETVSPELHTVEVRGTGEREAELSVPYRGTVLRGDPLLRQLDDWVARGITEPSFADAIGAVVRHPEWLDLRDRTFALVGAGSQMGPFATLSRWGATIAGVDLPRPETWSRLAETTRNGAGRLLAPSRDADPGDVSGAGANLMTAVGPVRRWLAGLAGPMTLGNYAYADGVLFVRLTMAFDLLASGLGEQRDDMSLSYLATPSDCFLVPAEAVQMATARGARMSPTTLAGRMARTVSGQRFFRPNYRSEDMLQTEAGRFGVVNALIVEQGPNYALAKRLQRWRMIVARAEGALTSVHVAPPTRTASVHSNPAMERRQRFTAGLGIETFDAATVQPLATALLVHDLRNPSAPANPATPLRHPHQAFMFAANPGGRWRIALDPNSVVPVLQQVDDVRRRAASLVGKAKNRGQRD